jgi:3-oxoacyl-(acyl-carrier-protein) synthase/NADP-dependent 3-hydroxy acid dehydrogenase YdfG
MDTACSSSLYAVHSGAMALKLGTYDVAVCGGALASTPANQVLFAKVNGLSKRGTIRAFDRDADGVVFADGAAVVVLKRLSRAVADGDQVLAVLESFGLSSDGKGTAVYKPSPDGQKLAIDRALNEDESLRERIDWVVAHGTGTPAGDLTEFTTLRAEYNGLHPVHITSNKSLIGHTGWAAGAVSLIEVSQGLAAETIPPQLGFTAAARSLENNHTNLRIPTEPVHWPAGVGRTRRAAVSGFGFGGTNAHVVVKEYDPRHPASPAPAPSQHGQTTRIAIVGWAARLPGLTTSEQIRDWMHGARPEPAGSFGDSYPIPPLSEVKLPPPTARTIDRTQLMLLECGLEIRAAFGDAWSEMVHRTGVFVGNMGPTRNAFLYTDRCYLDDVAQALTARLDPADAEPMSTVVDKLRKRVTRRVASSNEDALPGLMPNVIASRLSKYLDLRGPNMVLDTGLASSLTAFDVACLHLATGEVELALVGGTNGNVLPEYREILGDLIGVDTGPLAEGAFLFALTTQKAADRAALPLLGHIDRPESIPADEDTPRLVECGSTSPNYARYLGAAGALAVLQALHGDSGPVNISCHGEPDEPVSRLRLTVASEKTTAPARLPSQYSGSQIAPGKPTTLRSYVPVLTARPGERLLPRLPFVPADSVILTDQPDLLAQLADLPTETLILTAAPGQPTRRQERRLTAINPQAVRDALRQSGRPVKHLRILTDLSKAVPPTQFPCDPGPLTTLHDLAFLTIQECQQDLGKVRGSLIAILLGALVGGTPHPFSGLFTGLVTVAGIEAPSSQAFTLVSSSTDVRGAIDRAEVETMTRRLFPVVFDDEGTRKIPVLQESASTVPSNAVSRLAPDSVVVAVGGARGVTAEVVKTLAEQFKPTIYLLGSNPIDRYPPAVLASVDERLTGSRKEYIRRQLAERPGVTVATINQELARLIHARTARENIDIMRRRCGDDRVHYLTCDVTDRRAVAEAIGHILDREGNIDLLIHGAGLNRSALIRDKDFREFQSVRDVKLRGYLNLKEALRHSPPRMWCNFGSLLGTIGEAGEVDYVSGNDFLASAATHVTRTVGHDETTIGWTSWGDVGMVVRDELTKAHFHKTAAYSIMDPAEGAHHFIQQLHSQPREPFVLHVGEAERRSFNTHHPGYLEFADGTRRLGRYLRRFVSRSEDSANFECQFSLAGDPYLRGHLVDGEPTLPGSFATELAAEAALAIVPDLHVIAFDEVIFRHFVKVHDGIPSIPKKIEARVVERREGLTRVHVRMVTDFRTPQGVVVVRDRVHFETDVLLSNVFPKPTQGLDEPPPQARSVSVRDPYYSVDAPVRLSGEFVTTADIHLHSMGNRGRYTPTVSLDQEFWKNFEVPSLLIDGMARIATLELVDEHLLPLAVPLAVRRIDLHRRCNDAGLRAEGHTVEIRSGPTEVVSRGVAGNVIATDSHGRALVTMSGITTALRGYLDLGSGEFVHPQVTT